MEYTFHPHNSLAPLGMAQILRRNLQGRIPVIACVGSDLSIGDSLGPLVGSMIKQQCAALFVYGTLANPVTAKEVVYLREFIAETHPHSPVVAVDAAVGAKDEVGLIRIGEQGILPGSGAQKKLGRIGDVGILGIAAERSPMQAALLHLTRLGGIYRMAQLIAAGICAYAQGCACFNAAEKAQTKHIFRAASGQM